MLTAKQDTGRWKRVCELRKMPLNPYPRSVGRPPLIVTPLHTDFHPDLFFESGVKAVRKASDFIRAMITNQGSEPVSRDVGIDSRLLRKAFSVLRVVGRRYFLYSEMHQIWVISP